MNVKTDFKPVLTKAALVLPKKQEEFQAVIFEEPKCNSEKIKRQNEENGEHFQKSEAKAGNDEEEEGNIFDIKRTRHEVLKFAMNNQRVEKNRKKMMIYHLNEVGLNKLERSGELFINWAKIKLG
uniref:Uncharacterized protein n=1 Tax=Glossina brevipalpis TaxID=37001 RepID=A0A1A9WA65_9MUSC